MRGAVGTAASYQQLLNGSGSAESMEKAVLDRFGLRARDISTQTYPRKLDFLLLSALAGIGASLSKFAADIRILSSPEFGELREPFGEKQVGSSAMPFKRNPILCERIDSLARLLPAYADVAWQNAATNYLERTLDDSANRRTILPEALLCTDEIVQLAIKVVKGLTVESKRIAENLRTYGPFAGTESVLLEAVRAGGDRQAMHEVLRSAAMQSWKAIAQGKENPLGQLLTEEPALTSRLDPAEIRRMLEPSGHTGSAASRARALAEKIGKLPAFPQQSTPLDSRPSGAARGPSTGSG
jgi:adenylosuccinate lyase